MPLFCLTSLFVGPEVGPETDLAAAIAERTHTQCIYKYTSLCQRLTLSVSAALYQRLPVSATRVLTHSQQ